MPSRRTSTDSPRKLAKRMQRRWRVVLLRAKGEILGEVEAPDVAAAKAARGVGFAKSFASYVLLSALLSWVIAALVAAERPT